MTGIEWTDESWNPVTGCTKVSPGCAHCYAESMAFRLHAMGKDGYTDKPWTQEHEAENVLLRPDRLDQPLRWRQPRRVFVNSMSDLFHTLVPFGFVDQVFGMMAGTQYIGPAVSPGHTYQILTKRPHRMFSYLSLDRRRDWADWGARLAGGDDPDAMYDFISFGPSVLPNVWLGTSIEDDRHVGRADVLREVPAAIRFVSAEPLLGPLPSLDLTGIDWLIIGGESGQGHRPMDPAWVRKLVHRADRAGVAVFVKQASGGRPGQQGDLPDDLWARKEHPAA